MTIIFKLKRRNNNQKSDIDDVFKSICTTIITIIQKNLGKG